MVLRSFFAIDNESLTVTSSSNPGIVGDPVVNESDTPDGTIFFFSGGPLREITLNDTGGGRNRFNDDRPDDHVITDGAGLVADGTEVEAESRMFLRALDDFGNPTGAEIEIFVLSKNGNYNDTWGIGLSAPLEPGTSYLKVDGTIEGTVRYRDFITCFAAGTLIRSPRGHVPVEQIEAGQFIWTKGSGAQPVRWVASTVVEGTGALAPVRFEAGVLGNDSALIVSQQHRIWIENAAAELYFGQRAVLVAAKHLCGLPGVSLHPQDQISYTHFMFDSHQIVQSNGALTESFFLVPAFSNSISSLSPSIP